MILGTLATVTEIQQRGFEFARVPESWGRLVGVLLLAGICYAVIWLYKRERRAGAGARLRSILAIVRCLVMLGLAVIWLEPVIATHFVRSLNGRVAVLVDASASMSVRDAGDQGDQGESSQPAAFQSPATRLERVRELLLADDADWLRRLQQRNDLSVYAFGDVATRLDLPWETPADQPPASQPSAAASLAALSPVRPQTDFGQALTTTLDSLGDGPIAGIIFISDGEVNRGTSVDEIAAYAQRVRAPLYTIGVGSPREPPNVRLTSLAAPTAVPPDDPFEIRVELAATGVEPSEAELTLTVEPAGGGEERSVASRRVRLGEAEAPAPVLFEVRPPIPGEYTYRARVQPLPGESVTDDNVRDATVTILDKQMRVLVVAGGPSYEYRYLLPLLMRDKTVNVSAWLQSAEARAVRDGKTSIAKLPREPEEVFQYDVILLLDPDPSELDAAWAVVVRRWVDELGGGLLLQAGPQFTTRMLRDQRVQELVSILPVTPDPDADVRLNAQGTYRTHAMSLQIPDAALSHPLLALQTDPDANRAVWNALPGVWWYLPVLRAKPVAAVLLEQPAAAQRNQYGAAVLMAAQPVGAGRVAFLGFDTTWRWRGTAEEYYKRFWVRAIRYLAQARRQATSNRGTLVLDRESFGVGDYVKVEARVLDTAFNPLQQEQIGATLEGADGGSVQFALQAIPERAGWYGGRVLLAQAGPAVVRVPLPGPAAGEAGEFLTRRIRVQQPDIEMRALRLREELLSDLAGQTGGRYLPLRAAAALPELIQRAAERKPPQRAAAEPLWDRTWVLLALAGLLSLEWALRRRNHLL